jgi:hypothetical protein
MAKRDQTKPTLSMQHFIIAYDAFRFIAYGYTKHHTPEQLVSGMQWMIDNKMVERIDP